MSGSLRRGACPSLSAPMPTGDGLLVRINPRGASLTPSQLAGVAHATAAFGNGLLEITSRGSLQCRGLAADTVDAFAAEISTLGIEADEAPEIRLSPLAGRDAGEIIDPRPLAERLRDEIAARGLARTLAPKASIVIDSGGVPGLGGLNADIRLEAMDAASGQWMVLAGGDASTATVLGYGNADNALEAALGVLALMAEAGPKMRGRDIAPAELGRIGGVLAPARRLPSAPPVVAVGVFPLHGGMMARGVALPFSQIGSQEFASFATSIDPTGEIRLAPGGALLVLDLDQAGSRTVAERAEAAGLVARADDVRLRIVACAGSPSCASSHLPTKLMARAFVAQCPDLLAGLPMLHVSGCAKQCARPAGPSVSLIGVPGGMEIVEDGVPAGASALRRLESVAAPASKQRMPA